MDSSDRNNLPSEKLKRDKTEHPEIEETKQTSAEKEPILDTLVKSPVKRKLKLDSEIKQKRRTDNLDPQSAKNLTVYETEHPEMEETEQISPEKEPMLDTLVKSPVKRKSELVSEIKQKRRTDNLDLQSAKNLTVYRDGQDTVLTEDNAEKYRSTLVLSENKNKTSIEGMNREGQFTTSENTAKTSKTYLTTHDSSVNAHSSEFDHSESNKPKTENITGSDIDGSSKDETRTETMSEKVIRPSKFEVTEDFSKCKEVPLNIPINSPVKRKSQTAEDEVERKRSTGNVQIEETDSEIVANTSNVQDAVLYSSQSVKHFESTVVPIDNTTGNAVRQTIPISHIDQSIIKYKIETDLAGTSTSDACNLRNEEALSQGIARIPRGDPGVIVVEDLENDPDFVKSQEILLESILLESMKHESDKKRKLPKSPKNKDPNVKTHSSDNSRIEKFEKGETEHPKIENKIRLGKKKHDTPIRSPVKRKSESCFVIKSKRSTDDAGVESAENLTEISTEKGLKILVSESVLKNILHDTVIGEGRDIRTITEEEYEERLNHLREMIVKDPAIIIDLIDEQCEDITYIKLLKEMTEINKNSPYSEELEEGYSYGIAHAQSPNESPDSPPPESDSVMYREFSEPEETPTKGVKDTRYLKKYYKKKSLPPPNSTEDKASTSEIQPNIDSEKNQIWMIGDPQIVSRNSPDIVREPEDQKNILKDDPLKERKSQEDELSKVAASDSKNKLSIQVEKQIEVKDERYNKELNKPQSPDTYTPKIRKTDAESINRSKSNSPKSNENKQDSIFFGIQFEGLAARIMPPAGISWPPSSPAGASRPPSSPAGASRPPSSPAGASRPPSSPAGASRPPSSPAGASRPKK